VITQANEGGYNRRDMYVICGIGSTSRIFFENPVSLRKCRNACKNDNMVDLKEIGFEGLEGIHPIQDGI
jgi:hypothetical protein